MTPTGDGAEDPIETTRRLLRATLARGRAGAMPRLMREHCLEPERRDGGIVVQRLMLAPEGEDGRAHAVPIVIVHDEKFVSSATSRKGTGLPLICFMHGTGGDSEGLLETHLVAFAERGYCALGVDAPCHGRRLDPVRAAGAAPPRRGVSPENETKKETPDDCGGVGRVSRGRTRGETFERYGAALVAAWRGEEKDSSGYSGSARPFLYDGAWDCLRAVKYCRSARFDDASRLKIDSNRVGLSGISLGGMHAWLAAAAASATSESEIPRIAAVAPLIAAQDFGWGLRHDGWRARADSLPGVVFLTAARSGLGNSSVETPGEGTRTELTEDLVAEVYARLCPHLTRELDGPETFPCIAPTPLLVVNGELDPRTPLPGARRVVSETRKAYESHEVPRDGVPSAARGEAFIAVAQKRAAHECTAEMIDLTNDWLDWRLAPEGAEARVAEKNFRRAMNDRETWMRL
jgi:hypothetical protein